VPTIGKAHTRSRRPSSRTYYLRDRTVRRVHSHPASSGVPENTRGHTYKGVIGEIHYLMHLASPQSTTAVFQFVCSGLSDQEGQILGLCAVSFFAPHQAYSSLQDRPRPVDEFRGGRHGQALHRADQVISMLCSITRGRRPQRPDVEFPRLDNSIYYLL
jgi:glycogen operon protein